jgi:hypothetical protein
MRWPAEKVLAPLVGDLCMILHPISENAVKKLSEKGF